MFVWNIQCTAANDNTRRKIREGSVEEELYISTAKKSNMATHESPNIKETIHRIKEQEEPSLLEIKQLLVDIQIQIASVLTQNIALRKEIEEIKDSANFNEKELKDLKEVLQKTKDENKTLRNLLGDTMKEFKTAKNDIAKQKEDQLWTALDDLEQYTERIH